MDRGGSYATVVIPPGFTASLLNRAGVSASGPGPGRPQIVIWANQRVCGRLGAAAQVPEGPRPATGGRERRQANRAGRPVLLAAVSVMSMAGIRRTASAR